MKPHSQAGWITTDATISETIRTGFTSSKTNSRKPVCSPIAKYTVSEQAYTVKDTVNSDSTCYTTGQPAQVSYNPKNPSESVIVSGGSASSTWFYTTAIGIVFILFGLFTGGAAILKLRRQ